MPNYDLSVLNDKEFETLMTDLLSEEFEVRIERFKPGKDKGVDGRWFATPKQEVVVQCKHWARSGVAALIRNIEKEEKKKVDILAPHRYLFACSIPLSRENKKSIKAAFNPYLKSEADVLGLEDIQDLLGRHGSVERRHYKLWLASSEVLVALINNGVIGRSDDAFADIKNSLVKYVDTEEAARARERLRCSSVVIVKGEPGVGKTTLAQHLVLESAAEGYKLVVIERDVAEVEEIFDVDSKQIFYFDDFLGRNFLEALNENVDSHIYGFIKRVAINPNKRFVLTSRTHILDRGRQLSEIFQASGITRREFELRIGAISRYEKAKILYSHIWSSGMPSWAIAELYADKRYLEVVDHANYNPRLISFITDPEKIADIVPGEFWAYVVHTLSFPEAIWRHVFNRQVSSDTRDLAILVAFNGKSIEQDILELAFMRLNGNAADNHLKMRHRFMEALKLGVGSVLSRSMESGGKARCTLFNPSIADYLLRDEVVLGGLVAVGRALRTVGSVNYLFSLSEEEFVGQDKFYDCLVAIADDLRAEQLFEGELPIRVASLLAQMKMFSASGDYCSLVANMLPVENVAQDRDAMILFSETLNAGLLSKGSSTFSELVDRIGEFPAEVGQMAPLNRCAIKLDSLDGGSRAASVRERVIELWCDLAHDIVVQSNVISDVLDQDDEMGARYTVVQHVKSEFEKMGLELSGEEANEFADSVDYMDIISDNISSFSNGWDDESGPSHSGSSDAEISDYFDRSSAGSD